MQNQTLIQYFHWYYNEADQLWVKVKNEAARLAQLGFTGIWLPPAYKGSSGGFSLGYDAYDLYDLGEFDQKGSIATRYGNKQAYLEAIAALQTHELKVLADAVFNHKAGADELERIPVRKVNADNRNEFISDVFEIDAWTKFTFPGRNGKYSAFVWDYHCFTGVDWAEDKAETGIFAIQNEYGEGWEEVPATELGNYDYLMFDDLEFRNLEVRKELIRWGIWYFETTNVDGFRLDAVKHIAPEFIVEWIDEVKAACHKDFFFVAENWNITNVADLQQYIDITGGRTQLFDSLLHHNFYLAAVGKQAYALNTIFDNTLVQQQPLLAVTFVDNHDSQPLQALASFIDYWFRPLAYAMILLREQGIPCVFYTDLYGAQYEEEGQEIELVPLMELPHLLWVRKELAYGAQRDYLDHPNCIGWTRAGDEAKQNSGLAVLMSNGDEGFKEMELGAAFAGKTFIDSLGNRKEHVRIDEQGWGAFYCDAARVSVWVLEGALA